MSYNPLCIWDDCVLQDPDAGPDLVIELALAALSGRELQDVIGERDPISPRKECGDCLRRLLVSGLPFPTQEQHLKNSRAGRAYDRRHRRAAR